MSESKCPNCGGELHAVTRPSDSCLSPDQFDAVRAGDFYCMKCPSNDRGNTGYRYFWERELMDAKDARIAALTERLRAVEAERDEWKRNLALYHEVVGLIERDLGIEPMSTTKTIGGELSALRAKLERKDAALKAAESLAHWSNELIMHLEREFGPQPRFSSGHIGKICAAVREFRAALQPKEPPCRTA